jgi:ribosomal protein L16 Arg81 hydroxylase
MDVGGLLLGGELSSERFFAERWGQRWVKTSGATDRFASIFQQAELDRIVPGVTRLSVAFYATDGTGRTFNPPLDLARTLFKAGMTLIWSDVQHAHARLAELAGGVGSWTSARGPVSVQAIVSPPGTGFPWHYDFTHVLALQISGTKRWTLGRTRVEAPPFHQQADAIRPEIHELLSRLGLKYALPDDADADEVDLAPGDVLYVPPGTWHRARAGESSCHLSVRVRPGSFARLLRARLTATAIGQPSWRAELSRLDASGSRAALLQALTDRLAEARRQLAAITPEQLLSTMDELAGSPTLRDVLLERARDLL